MTFDELVDRLLAAIRVDASPGLLTHVDRLDERKRRRGGEKSAAGADALRTSTQDHPSLPTASPLPASDTRGPFKEAPGGDANHLIPDRIHAAALEQARRAYEAAAADTRAVAKQLGKYIGRITADQARKHSAGARSRAPAKPARAARDGD